MTMDVPHRKINGEQHKLIARLVYGERATTGLRLVTSKGPRNAAVRGEHVSMKVQHKRTVVVPLAVAGLALGLAVAGCSKGDETSSSSSSSSAASSSEATSAASSESSAAPTTAAAAGDYTSLLIKPETLPAGAGAFTADAPAQPPNNTPGAAQLLHNADNTAMIGDTVLIADTPEKAAAMLESSKQALGNSVTGTPAPLPSVGPDATVTAGTSPDGSKAITVLLFTVDNALVSLEFDSAPGDKNPVPTDFVEQVGTLQSDAIKTNLPNLPK
jgi:hypothetical protein